MWNDIVELREFYDSPLGRVARRAINRRVRTLWPDITGLSLLGLGFATPYLSPFTGEATRIIAAMPAQQGITHWPPDAPGLVSLCDEAEIPLPDLSMERIILAHGLECSENLRPMLREVWRVLGDGGRLMLIVPNRRGIWARMDRTPFGHGSPFTPGQMGRLLRDTLFTPMRTEYALFVPPSRSRMVLAAAGAWERAGLRWFQTVAGVLVLEASKQIYGATPVGQTVRRRRYAPAASDPEIS